MGEVLESQSLRFEICDDGSYHVLDRLTGVTWHSNPFARRFGSAIVKAGDQPRIFPSTSFKCPRRAERL